RPASGPVASRDEAGSEARAAERPLGETEGSRGCTRRERERVGWLQPATAAGGSLGRSERRVEHAPGDRVASRLERVAEREAVREHADLDQPGCREHAFEVLPVVAAQVPGPEIGGAQARPARRHAHEQPAARAEELAPAPERGLLVLEVLEHLEGTD